MTGTLRRRRLVLVLAGITVMVCSLAAGPVSSAPAAVDETRADASTGDRWLRAVAPQASYDAVEIQVDVAPNGSALWYIEYRYDLPTEAAVEGFNRTRRNITNPPGAFVSRFEENVVADAENATGRSMRLERGSVRTDLDVTAREGVVVYQFRWTNFAARPSEDRVVAGDAIARYDLGPNESLMIEWPDSMRRQSVSPTPDFDQSNAVRWTGPVEFRSEDPTVVLAVTERRSSGLPIVPALAVLVVALLVASGLYGRARRTGEGSETTGADAQAPPADLLSDEERVLRLLEDNGGRMRQQDLIEAVEWSRTKASDVVNEMHENEQIELFRLGRENVLALPGEIEI